MATYKAPLTHRDLLAFFLFVSHSKGEEREKKNTCLYNDRDDRRRAPGSVIDVDLP